MSEDGFSYEGEVILECQEGGYAAPAISLSELPGGTPQGVTAKVRVALLDQHYPKTLDEVLVEQFGSERINGGGGDESVGRLRIIVERVP